MRIKDDKKISRVKQACVDLTFELGVEGVSAGKVSKISNVSASSIYVYFENMRDMFQAINDEIIEDYFTTISISLKEDMITKDRFLALWNAAYTYCSTNYKRFIFTTRMMNSCIVDFNNTKEIKPYHEAINEFLILGSNEKIIKKLDVASFIYIAFSPLYAMLKSNIETGHFKLDNKSRQLLQLAAWDAIKM